MQSTRRTSMCPSVHHSPTGAPAEGGSRSPALEATRDGDTTGKEVPCTEGTGSVPAGHQPSRGARDRRRSPLPLDILDGCPSRISRLGSGGPAGMRMGRRCCWRGEPAGPSGRRRGSQAVSRAAFQIETVQRKVRSTVRVGPTTRLAVAIPLPTNSAELGADWATGNVVGGRWSVVGEG